MISIDRSGMLFTLVGPAGAGKTTLSKALLQKFSSLSLSISVTSRAPRSGEKDGREYFFVGKDEFKKRVDTGEFFEYEEVHGNFYGTLRSTLDTNIREGRDLLLDIDIRGALNFKRAYPDNAVIVFIVPPSFEELKNRVTSRSSVTTEELTRRIVTAKAEYSKVLDDSGKAIDYLLVNEDLERTNEVLHSIFTAESARLKRLKANSYKPILSIKE